MAICLLLPVFGGHYLKKQINGHYFKIMPVIFLYIMPIYYSISHGH